MIAIDTNVLIYRVIENAENIPKENKALVEKAKNKFSQIYGKHEQIAIPMPVLIEFANYLRKKIGTLKANEKIDDLIADENFKIIEAPEEYIHMANSISEEYGADFTDSLIYTILFANKINRIITYDSDFEKFKNIEIIR